MNGVHIRPVENGYILDIIGRERIATTLDEVLVFLVLHFEGREATVVVVDRLAPATPQAEPEVDPVLFALPDPAPEDPRSYTCPICKLSGFKRPLGVIGHAYGKHGETLTTKDILNASSDTSGRQR